MQAEKGQSQGKMHESNPDDLEIQMNKTSARLPQNFDDDENDEKAEAGEEMVGKEY